MPTYLPPRLGVSYSEAAAEAMASATVGDALLLTLALYHSSFADDAGAPTAAYVVNDYSALAATVEAGAPLHAGLQVTFQPVPFRYTRQEQTDQGAPGGVQIEIDNVSRAITRLLAQVGPSLEPVVCIEREYLRSDTSAPHVMPPTRLVLTDVRCDVTTVRARVSFGDLSNRKFPRVEYTREAFAALAAAS